MHLPGALVLSLGLAASAVSAKQQEQRPPPAKSAVLLSSVQSLTLRGRGAKTSHRRVPAAPQLRCVSPRALCDLHAVDVMRCTNQGSSYGDEDVEWSCAASLPAELKLGATDVVCEGYASSDDPYVLKGSCGVEYTLALTELGERRYPDLASRGGGGDRWFGDAQSGGSNNAWAGLFFLVFVAVVAWIVYSACVAASDNNRRQANTARRYGGGGDGGGGGGGGGGGWGPGGGGSGPRNDPPPPYPGTNNNSYKSSSNGGSSSSSQQQQGWRPGFWTGLAGGAAASYLASGRNRDNRNNYGYAPWGSNNYGSGSGSGSGSGFGSRWGGGDSWAGPSSSSSSSSRGGGSSSGERHESTGFGSTRRR